MLDCDCEKCHSVVHETRRKYSPVFYSFAVLISTVKHYFPRLHPLQLEQLVHWYEGEVVFEIQEKQRAIHPDSRGSDAN